MAQPTADELTSCGAYASTAVLSACDAAGSLNCRRASKAPSRAPLTLRLQPFGAPLVKIRLHLGLRLGLHLGLHLGLRLGLRFDYIRLHLPRLHPGYA